MIETNKTECHRAATFCVEGVQLRIIIDKRSRADCQPLNNRLRGSSSMKLEQQALVVLVFALAAILASCSGIPYNDVVVPAFKKVHPSAQVSQIYPVGGYGAESRTGGKTDIVIHFREVGSPLEEVWTVTREGGDWDVRFKCKSAGNVCLEEKGQTGAVK